MVADFAPETDIQSCGSQGLMRYEIREMSLGGILDTGILLFRDHFKKLYLICCFLYIPFYLTLNIAGVFVADAIERPMQRAARQEDFGALIQALRPASSLGLFNIIVLGLIANPLTFAAITYTVSEEYQGRTVSVKNAIKRALPLWLPMVWTGILVGLVKWLGLMMCLVPGGIFALFYLIVNQVVVVEGQSGVEAMRRSWNLMGGNIVNAFILTLVIFIIQMGILMPPALILNQGDWRLLNGVLESLFVPIALAFNICVYVAMYFSGRCRHEQFDMYMLAQALGRPAPAPTDLPPLES